jgi:hypothetical protein
MPQGTICLARLAAPVARPTQTDTARGRRSARIFRQALGLAVDRNTREFGKTVLAKEGINILMVSVIWNGKAISLPWTLPGRLSR